MTLSLSPWLISAAAFGAVAALVGALSLLFRDRSVTAVEDRLDNLMGQGASANDKKQFSVLSQPLDSGAPGLFESFFSRFGNISLLFEQADTNIAPTTFFCISGALAGAGWILGWVLRSPAALLPVSAAITALMPLMWVLLRRRKRFKAFATQLPDALELIARALRAGHSLQAGFQLVHNEMPPPIGKEFGEVFEEQNLGIPLEDALRAMTERMPNLDLKFFVTAVVLQRQTGGDLAEILDKIGGLIRERFKIWGQVQALTGEGRLSGVVLLALPPVLFLAVYYLNQDYIMVLFTDPMGKKLLAIALVMQVLGALVIRKIVNIKV